MFKKEEICKALLDIFKCDSVSYYEDETFNMYHTIFELKKDSKSYATSVNNEMLEKIPYKKVISYISREYIDLMLYGMNRSD